MKLSFTKLFAICALLMPISSLHSQTTYSFFVCGATGSVGPTQGQANATYSSTNLNGSVTVSSGIQQFTVPSSGGYKITVKGAKGYGTNGGRGATMSGDFTLTAGTVLKILVGQQGAPPISPGTNQYGGGGGSFVTYTNNTPLIVAGGGGGSWATNLTTLSDGTTSTSGNAGNNGPTNGAGGTAGSGGGTAGSADGGGGLTGNGAGTTGGLAFVNGGTGGALYGHGGFGGGGGGSSWDNRRGCGGGGYSGGGGAGSTTTGYPEGGGGGSFNAGINQLNSSGSNNGNGIVILEELCNVKITSSGSNSVAPFICSGTSLTLTTLAVSNYTWSTGNTSTTSIVVSPTTTTTYSIVGTGSANCIGAAAITVSVNGGIPVLSINSTTNNICLGQSVTLTASGATTYTWTGGINNGTGFAPTSTGNYVVTGQNACGTSTAQTSVTVAPLSVSAITTNSIVCAGQTTSLIASSAVNGYTWTPFNYTGSTVVVSPNINTTFTVTASDGTCAGTATVSIAALPIPTITSVASSTTFCEGNSATLTASGAVGYTWQPGNVSSNSIVVTPNAPTLYTVVGIGSNSCFGLATQIVIVQPSPTLVLTSSDPIICNGSSATLNVSGASTYTWNTNATTNSIVVSPTQNTSYTVTGENSLNNCTSSSVISISVFTPSISVSGNTAICIGSSATLQASGGSGYQWSNGVPGSSNIVNPTTNSVYIVTAITSTGSIACSGTGSIQVTVNPNPSISINSSTTSICKGENASFTASGANSYTWNTGSNSSSISITPSLVTTINFTVEGSNSFGCVGSNTVSLKVNSCVGLNEIKSVENSILVFPNPNNGSFKIKIESNMKINLYNQLGQLMMEEFINENNQNGIEIKNLKAGVYFLSAYDGQATYTKKIIVE